MVLIFVGALFTVLNFWIEFPSGAILQFFPDFVGYILIHIGVNRMLEREDYLSYQMYNSVIALRFFLGISPCPGWQICFSHGQRVGCR